MSRVDFRRDDLERTLLERARGGTPVVLGGPPGAGKTTLLRRLQRTLGREGWSVIRLDLMGAASSPERFLHATLDAIPLSTGPTMLPLATEIRRLAASEDRRETAKAVLKLLDVWSGLDGDASRPAALLLDEFTEIRSLAYFKDLRGIVVPFGEAMARRRRGTVLATSYPTSARSLFGVDVLEARPLSADEIRAAASTVGVAWDATSLHHTSGGLPRYVDALFDLAVGGGATLEAAWVGAMSEGGRLEAFCRHTHETLLLRSRGYGICKAVLQAVAQEEGLNLTSLCGVLGRTPGAVREYLLWLLQVDALRKVRKRYFFVDPLVRHWVRLHASGIEPTTKDVTRAFEDLGGRAREVAVPPVSRHEPSVPPHPKPPPTRPRRPASDTLIEID